MNAVFDESEQLQYETEGFVVRRDVFDPIEIEQIRDSCEHLVATMVALRRGRTTRTGSTSPLTRIEWRRRWVLQRPPN